MNKKKIFVNILLLIIFVHAATYSCSTCINASEPVKSNNALDLSVWSLLGVTGFALSMVISFITVTAIRIKKLKSKLTK